MKKHKVPEIASLSEALLSFDSAGVNMEVLEQRLEMVVIIKPCCLCNAFNCPSFEGCSPTGPCQVYSPGTS